MIAEEVGVHVVYELAAYRRCRRQEYYSYVPVQVYVCNIILFPR